MEMSQTDGQALLILTNLPDEASARDIATALVSHQLGRGHPGLDLAAAWADPEGTLALPPAMKLSRKSFITVSILLLKAGWVLRSPTGMPEGSTPAPAAGDGAASSRAASSMAAHIMCMAHRGCAIVM